MATTSDISRGLIIKLENNLYTIVDFGENKTARAGAKIWAKLKGVDNKRTIEKVWNSGENIFPIRVEKKQFQHRVEMRLFRVAKRHTKYRVFRTAEW